MTCLDYSVASHSKFMAYRFSGKETLCTSWFVCHSALVKPLQSVCFGDMIKNTALATFAESFTIDRSGFFALHDKQNPKEIKYLEMVGADDHKFAN